MRPMYYRRDGAPYEGDFEDVIMALCRDFSDPCIQFVKQDTLPNGKFISTVWLGLDHGWGDGPPLIFESMVFASKGNFTALDMDRYSTESEALAGHKRLIEKWL